MSASAFARKRSDQATQPTAKNATMRTKPLLALLMLLSPPCLAAEPAAELTVYYYERMPFFGDVNGQASGLLVDISRLIFDTAGVRYRLVNVPVVRFFEALKKPGNSCLIGALRNREREAIYSYSDDFIYQDQPFRVIVSKGKRGALPERPDIRQILASDLRLGLTEGYAYGDWLDGKITEHRPLLQRINIGSETGKMHKMIIAGRFDYMFSVAEEAHYVVEKSRENAENLTVVEIADAPRGNMRYLLCSKGIDSALMSKINVATGKVKAGRYYEDIINRRY